MNQPMNQHLTQQTNQQMFDKIRNGAGFVAALDQSGGSTPKALALYGVEASAYAEEAVMFDLVHEMRTRIMTSPSFTGDRILGAILFEDTMNREVRQIPTAEYLWSVKQIVPFLKVDKGLLDVSRGVQLMRPIVELDELLARALRRGIFGTKMRSLILRADEAGVEALVDQQFEVAAHISNAGLVPIIEPEVDIESPQKVAAEDLLKHAVLAHLDRIPADRYVMLKLTIPSMDNFYRELIEHPRVLRVLALSGGYERQDANLRLSRNTGMIASFSRALTEGLSVHQTTAEFDHALERAIAGIHAASVT
jgi:fructose-bisphosphate aldolase class I